MGALCHTSVSTINLLGNTIEESIIKRWKNHHVIHMTMPDENLSPSSIGGFGSN
jgi:hypothetical protein